MFDAFIEGLQLVLRWPSAGFLVLGTLMGILLGAIPGLGGVIGLVAMLPFTLSMDPVSAFALLLSFYAVTGQGDTITAIMLGVPGTVAGQATMLDGYPLAKQGQAARAFGAAFTVSAVGGVIGAVVLASVAAADPADRTVVRGAGNLHARHGRPRDGRLDLRPVAAERPDRRDARPAAGDGRLRRDDGDPALLVRHHLSARQLPARAGRSRVHGAAGADRPRAAQPPDLRRAP